ncbi:CyP450 monooxygenase [Lentinus tigrinus ALCF2SS1-7]|uniref:CyP450 monooxygenase n=1 Tax=Lentinus tigrinus ALCF2SS1-6 TaxID=1328759 RepID=A0A5C2SFW8_9APHY|nr:CyP450 monooxygenase [Lentinus tigrinus ALCF2SS1-6]RPD77555.1 CyP450 monooxygenase [Lentinus tigrinus ALCF2SS1-7]
MVSNNQPSASTSAGIALVIWFAISYALSVLQWRARKRGLRFPPGPTSLPFVGNIAHMRKPEPWKAHRTLCDTYGDTVYLPVLGQSIIILGGPRSISDLLDKRSAVTSDRQQSSIIPLAGFDANFTLMPYGQRWRRHRRAFWQHFLPASSLRYVPLQERSARLFLRKLLDDPSRLCEHIRYTFMATIVKVIYGLDLAETDPDAAQIEKMLEGLQALTPGKYLVEFLPFLQHLPGWLPGTGFQKELGAWRSATVGTKEGLFQRAMKEIDKGVQTQSVAAELVEGRGVDIQDEDDPIAKEIPKSVGNVAVEGGADTTFSSLQTFFLALSLNPNVLRKAQAQLHAVVGPRRLPVHADRENLPYITAIVKECLRWHPVLPFGLPHLTTQDMEYRGYFIPARTLLLANAWACLHDPEVYPEPERFLPDRFVLENGEWNTKVPDPAQFAFGFGRRICPGRHFAEASMFVYVAMVLHVFDISPPLDAEGKPIQVQPKMTNGVVSYPEDCRCTITPRSTWAKELILSEGV